MIDVFDVGIHLGMTTNGGHVIGELMRALGALDRTASMVSRNFDKMKLAAVGALGIFAGAKSLEGLWHMVEAAKDLNHELEKIKIGRSLDDVELARVKAQAFEMTQLVPGTTYEDNVKVQRELAATFKDMNEVHETLRATLVANQALSRFGDTTTDVAQVAVKALEMRGHISKDGKVDPVEFNAELNALTKSLIASNGMLKPNDYLQAIRQAGPAAMAMDANAFWGYMPAAMIGMGSAKAGTALMSLYQQVIGHVVAGKRIAVAMEDVGMLKPGSWHVERGGHVVMDQNAVVNQDQFAKDPFTYMHNVLEHIKTMKDKNGKPVDEVGLFQQIFQLASRATSARMIADIGMNWPLFQNEMRRYQSAQSGEQASTEQNTNDLSASMDNFAKALHNLNVVLGDNGVPFTIEVLHNLTDAVNGLSQWANANPNATHILFEVAAGLSAFSIALGTFAIGSAAAGALGVLAAPAGLAGMAIGVRAIATALGIMPEHDDLHDLATAIRALASALPEGFPHELNDVAGAMKALSGAVPGLKYALQSLVDFFLNGPIMFMIHKAEEAAGVIGSNPLTLPRPNINDYLPGHPGSRNIPWSHKTYGPNGNQTPGSPNYSPMPGKQSYLTTPEYMPRSGNDNFTPVRVVVLNHDDIGNSIGTGLVSSISRQPSGGSSYDTRMAYIPASIGVPAA